MANACTATSNESSVAPYTIVSWPHPAAADSAQRCFAVLLNPVWALATTQCSPSEAQSAQAREFGPADDEVESAQQWTVAEVVRAPDVDVQEPSAARAPAKSGQNAKASSRTRDSSHGSRERSSFVLVRLQPAVRLATLSNVIGSKAMSKSSANPDRVSARAVKAEPAVRWSAHVDGNVLDAFVLDCEIAPCADAARITITPSTRDWLLDTLARSGEMLQASDAGRLEIAGWFEAVAADGAYRVKPGSRALQLRGHVDSPSLLEFDVSVPKWNLAARCGRKQPKFACLWAAYDGRAHDRVCNGPRQRAGERRFVVPLPVGPFEVSVASDESDGCGWPQGTQPFVLSNPRVSSRQAKP